jgi:hypothetical protein
VSLPQEEALRGRLAAEESLAQREAELDRMQTVATAAAATAAGDLAALLQDKASHVAPHLDCCLLPITVSSQSATS